MSAIEGCRVLSKLLSFKRRVDRARGVIGDALSRMKRPYVATSMGKDSTVVLHLVRSVAPDTPALMGYDDWLLPETVELSESTPNLTRIAATIWHSEFYIAWKDGRPERLPDGVVWFDSVKNSRVAPFALQQGHDSAFIGLRKEEASYRRFHLNARGSLFFCQSHKMLECNPIGDWKVEDVWAYLLSYDVKYNKAYDVMTGLGIPLRYQRIGPLSVERVGGYGQLAILKQGWPALFNRFAAAYPEARSYV